MDQNQTNDIIQNIKGTNDDEVLKKTISDWYEKIHTQSMKIGASFIAAAVMGAINKNLKNGMNSSRRDLERAIKRVVEIVSVQLKQHETVQNDLEEITNDGTAE